jgi:GTP cyclohydrolase IA
MQNGKKATGLCAGQDMAISDLIKEIGDNHLYSSADTPLRPDAFVLDDGEKVKKIEGLFRQIMETLGLDLTDDSLCGTPLRVAKMYVEEVFQGLDPENKPAVTLFDNKYQYDQMLVEKDITVYSHCEHHFVPIYGKAHVGYISSGKVIGLSKLNRLVDYYARRPQVQERLTMQIGKALQQVLDTENVAVVIDAKHLCVASRGIRDTQSVTITSFYGGKFGNSVVKEEFLRYTSMTTVY